MSIHSETQRLRTGSGGLIIDWLTIGQADPGFVFCYWHSAKYNRVKQQLPGMGDRISMPISGDSPLDKTLNRGPWCCSCSDSMNCPLD